jgi:cell division protein YceG involved in septum cleavage/cytochrome c2
MNWGRKLLVAAVAAAGFVAITAPAGASSTILFCVSGDTVVRVEFEPGGAVVVLDDEALPVAPGGDAATPGPFVTRIGDTIFDFELLRDGDRWLLRTTRVRLPAGAVAAGTGACRAIRADDVVPRLAAADNNGTVAHFVTIPDGRTSQQVVDQLLAEPNLIGAVATVPPEGTLLPDSYRFVLGDTRQDVIGRMAAARDEALQEIWDGRAPDLPIGTPEELVILASIVERETGLRDERGRIAAVFLNRLARGMRLQSDATIIYGLFGGAGAPPGEAIRQGQIEQRTPYNTYQIDGLPPGPITNPSRAALEAVANPARTSDLYFVADGTGGHAFAETLEAHNQNVARWREITRQQAAAAEEALPLRTVTFLPTQAENGAEVYATNCAGCHGADLMTGFAPHLAGDAFAHWYDGPVAALWDKIATTMPMGNPGGLDAEAYADVIAFILRQNGFAVGARPFPPDPEALAAMAFAPLPAVTTRPDGRPLAFEDMAAPDLLAAIALGDAAAGEGVAAMCAGCHSFGEGEANRFGPNLYGIVYRTVGTHAGFTYSPTLTALGRQGGVWTFAGIDAFLQSPQAALPGTTMPFGGIADATDRVNLIAFLLTLRSDGLRVTDADLTQTIRSVVGRCWNPPAGWTNPADVRVTLQFSLNRDGTIQGIPQVIAMPSGLLAQAAADSAQRALYVCAPYNLPADAYERWRTIRVTFDPREMF